MSWNSPPKAVVLGLTEVTVGVVAVTTLTVAVAVTDVSATEVAVMITVLGEGTVGEQCKRRSWRRWCRFRSASWTATR